MSRGGHGLQSRLKSRLQQQFLPRRHALLVCRQRAACSARRVRTFLDARDLVCQRDVQGWETISSTSRMRDAW
jgi:hypothetical protein